MLITFKELLEQGFITEELHSELKGILNEPENDRESGGYTPGKLWQKKLTKFSAKVKDLSKRGEDSGLANVGLAGSKPIQKNGSSRAVFFPAEHKHITIDGVSTHMPTAVKVAFPGQLDKYTGDSHLLGEHQNRVESDQYSNNEYGVLHHTSGGRPGDIDFHHNPHGVLAPVLDHHEDHHWLEMAHAGNITGKGFTELTKTESHPKGLKFNDFRQALLNDHAAAHGQHSGNDEHDHLRTHPFYEGMQNFMQDTGGHPADVNLGNLGEFTHPVTGKKQVVYRDHGFHEDIAKLYTKARRNMYKY